MNASQGTGPVQTRLDGDVLVVTIDNPPVNALGQAVRAGLLAAVEELERTAQARAMLIVGAGKAFIAGADIREFGKPPQPPSLPETINRMEACDKLVVCAIHGPALGGGLEVAMATHFRLALPAAKLGLPEVALGLLPGAGGTQRSPRLMGALP
ncbi:MAG TPA: enoyl-CoA hydratase-related protein, partial [Ottowia sp.]|nr:enoyl-CoA hydratase-related protein [Ottowia sp.]